MKWSAFCWSIVIALGTSQLAQVSAQEVGSDERRDGCGQVVDVLMQTYTRFEDGLTFDRYQKELEIEAAGREDVADIAFTLLLGASIVEHYFAHDLSAEDFRIDFLHACISTAKSVGDVLYDLMVEKLPADHPLLSASKETTSNTEIEFLADGSVRPQDYRGLLGDEFEGTQVISSYNRRRDGEIVGCGFEFAHMKFDEIYMLGAPVKLSGSINIMEHPSTYLAGMIKIKGEDVALRRNSSGSTELNSSVFQIGGAYMTSSGEPINDNVEVIQCEDPEYFCQVNFEWAVAAQAMMGNDFGLGYQRVDGRSDVNISIRWLQPEGGVQESEKFSTCMLKLLERARQQIGTSE